MSRTNKDKPYALRKRKPKKHHGRLMREVHLACGNVDCCGFTNDVSSARAIEKRNWIKKEGQDA
jgi:hypothetical protein